MLWNPTPKPKYKLGDKVRHKSISGVVVKVASWGNSYVYDVAVDNELRVAKINEKDLTDCL